MLHLQLANLGTSNISQNGRFLGSDAGRSPAPELAVTPNNLANVKAFCLSPLRPMALANERDKTNKQK